MALTLGYAQSLTYPAALDRRIIGAGLAHTSGVGLRTGVIPAGGEPLKVTAATGLNLAVAAGDAAIDPYIGVNDSIASIAAGGTFANGVSSGVQTVTTARRDLVILRFYDIEAGHAGPSRAVVEIVKGTAAGADPAIPVPAYSLLLAHIELSGSQSTITNANITDRRVYTAAAGGAIPCTSSLTYPTSPYVGMQVYDTTGKFTKIWNGTAWATELPRLRNAGSTWAGSAWTDETGLMIQRWHGFVQSNIFGDFSVPWPSPFSGLMFAQCSPVDPQSSAGGFYCTPRADQSFLTSAQFRLFNGSGSVAVSSGNLLITAIGYGW